MVGQLSCSSRRANVCWSDVSVECLKQMSPDVNDCLSSLPAKWSAADLSLYCTDRDNCGVFASMFACSWGSVVKAKAYRGCRDALIALVGSDAFRDAAQDHFKQYGTTAHVLQLVKQFGDVSTWRF